jgi:hypothetical protein
MPNFQLELHPKYIDKIQTGKPQNFPNTWLKCQTIRINPVNKAYSDQNYAI